MPRSQLYFRDGKLIAESGDVRIYEMDGKRYLEKGKGHTLWAHDDEINEYTEQLGNFPKGDCLEIGLGLGVASRYLLSFPCVRSLTTVELDENVIEAQKKVNKIEDPRHLILNSNGLLYAYQTKSLFDFIFLDFYTHIDDETLPVIADMSNACRRVLKPKGRMMGWIDPATSGEHYNFFMRILEAA
jgi:spermidine synthase